MKDLHNIELAKDYLPIIYESLEVIEGLVVSLEKSGDVPKVLRELLGIIHSIKGGAGSYQLDLISKCCHVFEEYIEREVLNHEVKSSSIDSLLSFCDFLDDSLKYYCTGEGVLQDLEFRLAEQLENIVTQKEDKWKVLIVEPSTGMTTVYSNVLKKFNAEIETCKSGSHAQELLTHGVYNILLTSRDLDEASGAELIKIARERIPEVGSLITVLISSRDDYLEGESVPDFLVHKGPKLEFDLENVMNLIIEGTDYYRGALGIHKLEKVKQVLVVDDDIALHPLIKIGVKKQKDWNIHFCNCGTKVFEICSLSRPDLIILDVMMPHITGLEVKNILNKNKILADIPCIFLTGKYRRGEINELLKTGAIGIIRKPFNPRTLLSAIYRIYGSNITI